MAKCWLLPLFLVFLLPAASATSCHPDDLRALRGFVGNLNGGGDLLHGAWSGSSCCAWAGVGCDGTSGRVTALRLPISLEDCGKLKSLNLANDRLVGTSPSWIGELDHLCYLVLSDNSVVGHVPNSLQIRLNGLTTVGRALGMAFANMPLRHVNGNRRTLDEQTNTIHGSNNTVRSGNANAVSGNDNTVICGNHNTVSGSNNTIVSGSDNIVSGSNQVVCGTNQIVTDNNNDVSGNHNNVSGSFHTVSGSHNTVSGSNNTVSGSNHVVSGSNKVVTGDE